MNNTGEMQMQLMIASLMPEGYDYDTLLSDDDRNFLDETLKEYVGAGLEQMGTMKPAMLNTLLSVMMYKKFYPTDEEEMSMDEHFQKEARDRYRQTLGLESVEDQITVLFGTQSIERQAEVLMCNIKNMDYGKQQMDKLMDAYFAQDLTAMAKLYEEDDPNSPCPSVEGEKDLLNKARNEKWMERLPEMMSKKSSFIAVGCLHLVGKDGLIQRLRDEGYRVEAVVND